MTTTHAFLGLPVSNFSTAYEWYVRLFGREADMFPKDGEAVWHVTPDSSVYVVDDPTRAGSAMLALAVNDLDTYRSRFRAEQLAFVEQPGRHVPLHLRLTDENGNTITFFEDPGLATF
jgi:hypothetical protein